MTVEIEERQTHITVHMYNTGLNMKFKHTIYELTFLLNLQVGQSLIKSLYIAF